MCHPSKKTKIHRVFFQSPCFFCFVHTKLGNKVDVSNSQCCHGFVSSPYVLTQRLMQDVLPQPSTDSGFIKLPGSTGFNCTRFSIFIVRPPRHRCTTPQPFNVQLRRWTHRRQQNHTQGIAQHLVSQFLRDLLVFDRLKKMLLKGCIESEIAAGSHETPQSQEWIHTMIK